MSERSNWSEHTAPSPDVMSGCVQEVTKLRQKLEYLHAEKTSAIATKDFERTEQRLLLLLIL